MAQLRVSVCSLVHCLRQRPASKGGAGGCEPAQRSKRQPGAASSSRATKTERRCRNQEALGVDRGGRPADLPTCRPEQPHHHRATAEAPKSTHERLVGMLYSPSSPQ